MSDQMQRLRYYAPLLIRIGLAAVFIVHGWGKLTGIDGTAAFFGDKVGLPAPTLMAWLVAIFEFGGGLLVLLGIYTRIGAIAIAVVMLGAMITVKFAQGFQGGWEFDFVLLLMAVSLLFSGPGSLSLDEKMGAGSE